MKKILLGLCLVAVAAGCDNSKQQNELNKEEQYKATIAAENSPTTVSELPFNLRFNMNKVQVDSALSISVKSKTISNYEDMYYYDCKLKSGKTIKTNLSQRQSVFRCILYQRFGTYHRRRIVQRNRSGNQ